MSTVPSLLPPSSTPLERAIEQTQARFDPPQSVKTMWNADTCPVQFLPYLAWALSVDEWDHNWSIDKKRAVIKEARPIHMHKGTPFAIRTALASVGQADAQIIERSDYIRCDGSVVADGYHSCGGRWATYRVVLKQAITVRGAQLIKRLLKAVGRNAVWLLGIDYSESSFICDGTVLCNGDYTCGAVDTTLL